MKILESFKEKYLMLFSIVIIMTLVLGTLFMFRSSYKSAVREAELEFKAYVLEYEKPLVSAIERMNDALLGAVGFFQGSNYVSASEWKEYIHTINLNKNFPGAYGMGYMLDLHNFQIENFLKKMQKEEFSNYTIHPLHVSRANFIIKYIEPLKANRKTLGLNIAFEDRRYNAAKKSRDEGKVQITEVIHLIQDANRGAGFLLLQPFYDDKLPQGPTVEERRKFFKGWIYMPIIAKKLVQTTLGKHLDKYHLKIYSKNKTSNQKEFIYSDPDLKSKPLFRYEYDLDIYGQKWYFDWESSSEIEKNIDYTLPYFILVGGLLFTLLLGLFLYFLARLNKTINNQVKIKTKELRDSEETLLAAMRYAPIGVCLVDIDMNFIKVNKALCSILRYNEEELHQLKIYEITHPSYIEETKLLIKKLIDKKKPSFRIEKRMLRKDNTEVWVDVNVALVRDLNDEPKFFIEHVYDLTERMDVERMKNEFLSVISHELKTPLTSIKGSLWIMRQKTDVLKDEELNNLYYLANKNCNVLQNLIMDLLDANQLAMNFIEVNLKKVLLDELLDETDDLNKLFAESKGVHFEVIKPKDPISVNVDASRLVQVLTNLISNAVKYSPKGGTVKLYTDIIDNHVRIYVEDGGKGIPDEFKKHLFTLFAQVDSAATRNTEGTGLGLYIAKGLVERMNGKINYISIQGKGTTFWIDLPIVS